MAQLTTFVFTDLVGSVDLKRQMPGIDAAERDAAYVRSVLQPHRERIERGLSTAGGRVVSTAGDGHFVVFPDASRAALWAMELVLSHEVEPIGGGDDIDDDAARDATPIAARVRVGLHVGAPQPDPADSNNYIGRAVDYAARLVDHAQGGQVLASRTAASIIEDHAPKGVLLHDHGGLSLRGIGDVQVYEVLPPGRRPQAPRRSPSDAGRKQWSVLPHTMGLTEYGAQSGATSGQNSAGVSATAVRPRRIGSYELTELLGAGGMGNVYKARHLQFDRPRALKVIRPDLVEGGGDSVVRRFYQEIRATGALEHPNLVVAIDSSSPEDDEHFLVMEYLDGVGVERLVEQAGRLPIADACEIARQAALGLAHLDAGGLVHRDVKPSNLMVTLAESAHLPSDSRRRSSRAGGGKLAVVKLMDLGLALLARPDEERLTRMDRGGMGTGLYMPPEQWRSTSVDIRADVYSLGCTLWCLLTGEPPFARSDLRPERAHATEPPPIERLPEATPPALRDLLLRMLAKSPDERPSSPSAVATALEDFVDGQRLAERVLAAREGKSAATRDETRAGAALIDTDARASQAASRRGSVLTAASGSRVETAKRWGPTVVATLVACGAVAMLALASAGWREAMLRKGEDNLKRAASLAAGLIAEKVNARVSALEASADDAEVGRLVATLGDADANEAERADAQAKLQRWLTRQRDRSAKRFRSSSWFVTDAEGYQVARSPTSADSLGKRYNTRDYFHGAGLDTPADPQPLTASHQSTVYRSTTSGKLKVAFSTPIRAGSNRVVGVLGLSVTLGQFTEFEALEAQMGDVEIVLADVDSDDVDDEVRSGLVLHHAGLARYAAGRVVRLGDDLVSRIRSRPGGDVGAMLGAYPDLLGRDSEQPYWGAFAPVGATSLSYDNTGRWVVIAQEPEP